MAIAVDRAVMHTKPDSWVGNPMKERKVKRAIRQVLPEGFEPARRTVRPDKGAR